MGSTSGLSSILRDLARGRRRKPADTSFNPVAPIPDDELTDARIETSAAPRSIKQRTTRHKNAPLDPRMRRLTAALLAVVGLAMLIPAVWALGVVCGYEPWRYDRANAGAMALVMLTCWPIALALLTAAVMMLRGGRRT